MAKRRLRWGSIREIDYRTSVGSQNWKKHHKEAIQHLSAYRRLHALVGHEIARRYVNASIKEKLLAIRRFQDQGMGESNED